MSILMSVDPGATGTGIALWRVGFGVVDPGIFYCKNLFGGDGDWWERADQLVPQLSTLLHKYGVVEMVIEYPQFMESLKGQASSRQGDTLKLAFLVGRYVQAARELGIRNIRRVQPDEWKGQLPKDVVERRIIAKIPEIVEVLNPKTHSWDAIGIGLWYTEGKL